LWAPDRPIHEGDEEGYTPLLTGVTGVPLYAPWQSPLEISWDFGDGETASGVDLWWTRHQYAGPGDYEVILTITDTDFPGNSLQWWT